MFSLRGPVATLLASLIGCAGVVVLTPAPAFACSCSGGSTEQFSRWADVVVFGTITDRQEPPPKRVIGSMDPVDYTVEVAQVFKGEAGATTVVTSARMGVSCGLEDIQIGEEYVVFATADRGELWASLCGGTRLASPSFEERLEEVTGPGRVVDTVVDGEGPATSGADADQGNSAGDDPPAQSAVPGWAWVVGVGLLAALGAGLGIVVRRLRAAH